jgi:hypothetical protein
MSDTTSVRILRGLRGEMHPATGPSEKPSRPRTSSAADGADKPVVRQRAVTASEAITRLARGKKR